jgi:hypothetical protein
MTTAEARRVQRAESEAQYRAYREAREARAAEVRAQREAAADQRRAEKAAEAAARRRSQEITTTVRIVGRVASSRTGQSIIRSIFGTLLGGSKR